MISSIVSDAQKNNPEGTSSTTPNNSSKPDFVKWFFELNKDSGPVAGGKGANLAEIFNLKIPVPQGFVVTAQAYDYFLEKAGIKEKIHELLDKIDYEDTQKLNEITKNIRAFIVDSKMPREMEEEILESYEHLSTDDLKDVQGSALNILRNASEPAFVAVRSSATTEDLADASFAGQQDTYLNVKGKDELIKNVKKCFASLFTARATYYRNKKGFKHEEAYLAVIVQKMVDSDKSGVIFSKDPTFKNENIIIEAVWGLGEGIVSGKITPDRYLVNQDLELIDTNVAVKKIAITRDSSGSKGIVHLKEERAKTQVLNGYEIKRLSDFAQTLEEHYGKPQDIEFAIENEDIYIVQTRPITTMASRQSSDEIQEIKGDPLVTGLAASPGIASGQAKIIEDLEDLHKIKQGDILVTGMTNPDMVVSMQKSAAVVTDEGGMTAHAAIVSREMGMAAVVGTDNATEKIQDGEIITVDGYTGKVYRGKVAESTKKKIEPITANTKTKIKVIVDLPNYAERAAKAKAKAVGLTRIEGIIAESGKHPNYFIQNNKYEDYEEIIYKGISKIAHHFEEVWVRTSDVRSDEYSKLEGAPTEIEANPMLGFHGIRYSLKFPELLKSELRALKRVANESKKVGILMPQVILPEELQKTKKIIQEIGLNNLKVGIMIETPAAVQLIKDFIEDGIDFISFGTNDLTQYMLAIDRGNEKVQDLYDEMHPAILYQLNYVIRTCKRSNVETSICGQAGSRKEMVAELVKYGIDSISTNADMAAEIADYVYELETGEKPPKRESEEQEKPEEIENNGKDEISSELELSGRMEGAQGGGGRVIEETERKEEPIQENIQKAQHDAEIIEEKINEKENINSEREGWRGSEAPGGGAEEIEKESIPEKIEDLEEKADGQILNEVKENIEEGFEGIEKILERKN